MGSPVVPPFFDRRAEVPRRALSPAYINRKGTLDIFSGAEYNGIRIRILTAGRLPESNPAKIVSCERSGFVGIFFDPYPDLI